MLFVLILPELRNGRRGGLKIRCPQGRVGSTPTFLKILENLRKARFMRVFDRLGVQRSASKCSKNELFEGYRIHRNSGCNSGAREWSRTITTLRSLDFESSASASSATRARSK